MQVEHEGTPVFIHTGGVEWADRTRPLLLLHGAGMDHTVFRFQARALAHHGYAVLAPDLPGHGHSGGLGRDSISAYARWVLGLLDGLELDRVSIVGHSMGALIGLEMAAVVPERVAALVLLGPADQMVVHPALQDAADQNRHLAHELITGWSYGLPGHLGGHPQPGTWMAAGTLRVLENSKPGVLAGDLSACSNYRAGPVAVPTLILIGLQDKMTAPAMGRRLAEAIQGVRVVELDGGHMLMVERPGEVLREIEAFLAASTIS